jgi:hypothetical protein
LVFEESNYVYKYKNKKLQQGCFEYLEFEVHQLAKKLTESLYLYSDHV